MFFCVIVWTLSFCQQVSKVDTKTVDFTMDFLEESWCEAFPESTGIMRGVERDHDGIISVTLRNPWGFDETMPAEEFLRTWHCMRQSRKSALGCCLPVYHVNQLARCFSLGWFSRIKVIKIVRPIHCFKEILSVTGSFFLIWPSLQKVHKKSQLPKLNSTCCIGIGWWMVAPNFFKIFWQPGTSTPVTTSVGNQIMTFSDHRLHPVWSVWSSKL